MADANQRDAPLPDRRLSPRQLEVLALIAGGLSSQAVADKLGISPGTVKTHLTMIYKVIGAKNRVQATRYYLDHLVPGSPE